MCVNVQDDCTRWNMPWKPSATLEHVWGFSPTTEFCWQRRDATSTSCSTRFSSLRRSTSSMSESPKWSLPNVACSWLEMKECGHKQALMFSSDMACSVAGITSDANVLTNELRLIAQRCESWRNPTFIKLFFPMLCIITLLFFSRYLLQYQEPIPCEQLVTALCDIKQAYTQFGGKQLLFLRTVSLLDLMSQSGCCGMTQYFASGVSWQGRDPLEFLCSTWAGTNIMVFSCIRVTPAATTEAGRRPVLAITVL